METTPKVIRRPQTVLVIYEVLPRTVIKLSQRDASSIEQLAGTAIDFLSQTELVSAIDTLAIQRLPLDDSDRAELVRLATPPGVAAAAAPSPPPAGTPALSAASVRTPPPAEPPVSVEEGDPARLRWGLVAGIIGLVVVLILVLLLLSRFFGGPSGATPTETPAGTTTATITVTATPGQPTVIALSNVSVRSGPDGAYPVVGILPAGGSAQVIGRNQASTWWLVQAPNIQGNQGWVPDDQVTTSAVSGVPVATPPPLPTPTPTPLQLFNGWKGEYFDNPDVRGEPVYISDDPQINFNWGAGSPAPGVPPNDYSVRWTRQQPLDQGVYRFSVNVEGGVRLWLDGNLLIDSWRAQGLRLEQADSGQLAAGVHDLRVEYRKLTGNGQIAVSWQLVPQEPPVAMINGPATGQAGQQLRFSAAGSTAPPNGRIVSYEWRFGDGSTGSGVEVTQTYAQPATYEVLLVVTADNGLASTATQQVTIAPAPEPPTAVISAPSQGLVNQPLTFDGSQSSGQTTLSGYLWTFGDGVAATGQVVQHADSQPGSYTVSLTVTDSNGLTGSSTAQIQIAEPVLTPTPTPTTAPLSLEGTNWQWDDALPGAPVSALFQDGTVSGNGGCNNYSGSYEAAGQSLTVGPLGTTGQLCDENVMAQEASYLTALQGAQGYEITEAQLRIFGVAGDQTVELFYTAQ